jgi:hypothetical protein
MENLRSALDYMAKDIATIVCKVSKTLQKNTYFPYGKNKKDYNSSIGRSLPNLKIIHPDIYSLLENLQPHICGDAWLYDFCQILNNNKHDSLSPQTRKLQKTYSVGLKGKLPTISALAGAITAPPGAISIDGIPIEFDQNTGIPYQTSGLEVAVTTWVNFVFQGTTVEVYPILQTAFNKIKQLSEQLYKIIKVPPSPLLTNSRWESHGGNEGNHPLWEGKEIESDILNDFYLIAKTLDTLSPNEREALHYRSYEFLELQAILKKNGYSSKKAITEKLIEVYTQKKQRIEEEIFVLEKNASIPTQC